MSLCERCGNYPTICGCAEAVTLAARLADLTREAKGLLSFIDGQTHTPEEDQIYSQAEEGELRSMPGLSSMDPASLSLLHPLRNAPGLGKMATKSPVPSNSQAAIHWYESTPEI